MTTFIYMVRHGESPKLEGGNERTRGLTAKGQEDAHKVTEVLRNESIDLLYSSPYARAIQTINGLAQELGTEIQVVEELRETQFRGDPAPMTDQELYPLLESMFADPDYALPGGESNDQCQQRAVPVLQEILRSHRGQRIAIGTHGLVMTLMMNYFDPSYDLDFLLHTVKPDIYKMEFSGEEFMRASRLPI